MVSQFCPHCGNQLQPNARYCARCGQPVGHLSGTAAPGSMQPTFHYPKNEKHSHTITSSSNGIPVVEFRDLHPNSVALFFFSYLGKTAILVVLFLATAFIEPLIAAIFSICYVTVLYLIAKLLYKSYRFEVNEYAFRKEYGVIHKRTVSIPFEQVQNVNVRRSVIDQVLGLSHLEIETAGDSGVNGRFRETVNGLYSRAEGYIPGVSPKEASDLRDLLLARMQQTD